MVNLAIERYGLHGLNAYIIPSITLHWLRSRDINRIDGIE